MGVEEMRMAADLIPVADRYPAIFTWGAVIIFLGYQMKNFVNNLNESANKANQGRDSVYSFLLEDFKGKVNSVKEDIIHIKESIFSIREDIKDMQNILDKIKDDLRNASIGQKRK